MDQPPGFEVHGPSGEKLVCKLNKDLYGLKQAPRAWFHTLRQHLVEELRFKASKADPSLFYQKTSSATAFVIVYVDDIVVIRSSTEIKQLHNKFSLKDVGELHFSSRH